MDFLRKRENLLVIGLLVVTLPPIIALVITYGTSTKKESPPQSSSQKGYLCPTTKEFCQNGTDVTKNSYLGFGINATANHPIYAVFDGEVTVSQTILPKDLGGETLQTIYIDNKQDNLRAVYLYIGQSFAPNSVQKGVIIGKMEKEIKSYNTWLIFQLIKGDPLKGEKVKLSSKDFMF